MILYQRFTGTSWPGSHQLVQSSLDPCWHTDICSPQSPLSLPISPSLDIQGAYTLYFLKTDLRICSLIFLVGALSINKMFFSLNSNVLSFGHLKHQAHRLWTNTNWGTLIQWLVSLWWKEGTTGLGKHREKAMWRQSEKVPYASQGKASWETNPASTLI